MIVFDDVTKFFPTPQGRKYILRDASFTLKTGENVGVIGPNGAGKTTMMRLICGVDVPNSGRISTTYFLSWPMGIAGGMQGVMSGRENARFVCRILGEPEERIPEKLKFIQAFAEIGDDFDLPVKNYSSGMRARLNFAISMGFDFDCYVVDELTAVGDQKFREKSAKFFRDKRDEACFIKVSHNLKELEAECDSALLLMNARLYYFPEVKTGTACYRAVTKGDVPDSLDDFLIRPSDKGANGHRSLMAGLAGARDLGVRLGARAGAALAATAGAAKAGAVRAAKAGVRGKLAPAGVRQMPTGLSVPPPPKRRIPPPAAVPGARPPRAVPPPPLRAVPPPAPSRPQKPAATTATDLLEKLARRTKLAR